MRIIRIVSMLLLLCALTISSKAQSPTQNYVMSKEVLDVDGTHAITTVTYYDGLGNPVETATNGLGGTGKYAYTLQEHDALGREKQSWLPGTAQSGCSFVSPSELSSSLIAFHNDQNPYSLNRYDVLDRQISTLGAGESWHKAKKSVNQRYSSNESNSVKRYQVSGSGTLEENGYYAAKSLSMLEETDEDGKLSRPLAIYLVIRCWNVGMETTTPIIYMTISVGFAMCFLRLIRNIQICKSLAMSIVMTNMADVCGNVCQVVNINKCGMMRPTT